MNTTEEQIQKLDKEYILIWANMQSYAKGSKKHRALAEQFKKISAEIIKLKNSSK
jgi:hypothetical protein